VCNIIPYHYPLPTPTPPPPHVPQIPRKRCRLTPAADSKRHLVLLPAGAVALLCSFLDPKSLEHASRACRAWRRCVSSVPTVWKTALQEVLSRTKRPHASKDAKSTPSGSPARAVGDAKDNQQPRAHHTRGKRASTKTHTFRWGRMRVL
jgi:hypothetical protein